MVLGCWKGSESKELRDPNVKPGGAPSPCLLVEYFTNVWAGPMALNPTAIKRYGNSFMFLKNENRKILLFK